MSSAKEAHYLSWVTHKTQWPLVLTKYHPASPVAEYDWFKYDDDTYVTSKLDYKPNYFVSKTPYKSDLTIFTYDAKTHEPLTTYEPIQFISYNHLNNSRVSEYYTLAYLNSHRIRIDRDEENTGANITCIADFLVDETSLRMNDDLVEEMKNLALFKVNLNERSLGDFNQFIRKVENKNNRTPKRTQMKMRNTIQPLKSYSRRSHIRRIKRDGSVMQNKSIMNVRLSFGPVHVSQPIENRLVSCTLDLVNDQTVQLDYHDKIFKFLSEKDMGLDKNYEDLMDMKMRKTHNTPVLDTTTRSSVSEEITSTSTPKMKPESSTHRIDEMSDEKLNEIFKEQEVIKDLEEIIKEHEIIKEQGIQKYETEILESIAKNEESEKEFDRRFDEHFAKDRLFFIDPPTELKFNASPKNVLDFYIFALVAFIHILFY